MLSYSLNSTHNGNDDAIFLEETNCGQVSPDQSQGNGSLNRSSFLVPNSRDDSYLDGIDSWCNIPSFIVSLYLYPNRSPSGTKCWRTMGFPVSFRLPILFPRVYPQSPLLFPGDSRCLHAYMLIIR